MGLCTAVRGLLLSGEEEEEEEEVSLLAAVLLSQAGWEREGSVVRLLEALGAGNAPQHQSLVIAYL